MTDIDQTSTLYVESTVAASVAESVSSFYTETTSQMGGVGINVSLFYIETLCRPPLQSYQWVHNK